MNETEYNRGSCRSFTASDVKCSRSIYKLHINQSIDAACPRLGVKKVHTQDIRDTLHMHGYTYVSRGCSTGARL